MHTMAPHLPRDVPVQVAWLATRCSLMLMAPVAHMQRALARHWPIGAAPATKSPAVPAQRVQLGHAVERHVLRSDMIRTLHHAAADAIESAEDDIEHLRALCSPHMQLPPRAAAETAQVESDFAFLPAAA